MLKPYIAKVINNENLTAEEAEKAMTIIMRAWEEIGGGFGNIRGIGVLLLAGARMPLWVTFQDAAHNVTTRGKLWMINNPGLTTLPTVT